MSPNLDKWIRKSISTWFLSAIPNGTIKTFQEGQFRDTNKVQEHLELRVDGPWYQQIAKRRWRVRIEVNVLAVVNIKTDDSNWSIYRINELTGLVASVLETAVPVTNTDGGNVGCLSKIHKDREWTKTSHFGQIEPHTKILQSTVESSYEMEYQS